MKGGGGVFAMTYCESSEDEHSSATPAGFDIAHRRSSKSPLAEVGPFSSRVIKVSPNYIVDIRDCPIYRDWNWFVKVPHDGDNGTGVFGVYARYSFPAMSFDNERFLVIYKTLGTSWTCWIWTVARIST